MSACSSQLSASLLGSDLTEEADSAAVARTTSCRPKRSVSAGRSARPNNNSNKVSLRATQKTPLSARGSAFSSANTSRSPLLQAASPTGTHFAESVASQGRTQAQTPESSASTGKSQALAGKSQGSKPHWQQATASSRHSQHNQSITASQGPKPNFLARLQDHASSKGTAAASKHPQQYDAKAAEMKAKLMEWRQQQQQQKMQKQQPGPKQQPAASAAAPLGRRLPAQRSTAQLQSKPRGSLMNSANQAVKQASATPAALSQENGPAAPSQENAPAQHGHCHTGHGKLASKEAYSSPTSSTASRQPLNAVQNSTAVQSPEPSRHYDHQPGQGAVRTSLGPMQASSFPAQPSLLDKASTSVDGTVPADHDTHKFSASCPSQRGLSCGVERAVPAATQGHFSAAAGSGVLFELDAAEPVAGSSIANFLARSSLSTRSATSRTHVTVAQSPELQLSSAGTHSSSSMPFAALAAASPRAYASCSTAAPQIGDPAAQLAEGAVADVQPSCSSASRSELQNRTANTAEPPHRAGSVNADVATDVTSLPSAANAASTAVAGDAANAANAATEATRASKHKGITKGLKQAKAKGPTVEEKMSRLQCLRWQHLQWLFLNCRLEEAMQKARPKAEQALTNVAQHIVTLQQEVAQQRLELRAAERQQRVEAALAAQTPKLLRWQGMQAEQRHMTAAVQSAMSNALQHVPLINGATAGASRQEADVSAVAASVSRLQDSLRQCQGHVNTLMGQAAATAQQQNEEDGSEGHAGSAGLQRTAQMAMELAQTSEELKQYLVSNSQMLETYSYELLHVQSLAAQLVQMQHMQR